MPGSVKMVLMPDICLRAILMDSGQWVALERHVVPKRAFILETEIAVHFNGERWAINKHVNSYSNMFVWEK